MRGLLIIPAYNEAASITPVLERLKDELPSGVDVLVVNDGSKDDTADIVRRTGVLLCDLPCNLGYALALKTGMKYGVQHGYDWMSFMDADGQHRTEDMLELIREYEKGEADMITGSRWMLTGEPGKEVPAGRRTGMLFFSRLASRLTGRKVTDTTSGMKILSPTVAKELVNHHFGDFHSEVIVYLHDRGYKLREHPITVLERTAGTSMYSFHDAVFYPLKNLILILVFKLNSLALKKVKSS